MSIETRLQMRVTCDFDSSHQSNRNVRDAQTIAQRNELPEGWVAMRGPNGEELHFDTEACATQAIGQLVVERWQHFNPEPQP
jgi:hypothetical protein